MFTLIFSFISLVLAIVMLNAFYKTITGISKKKLDHHKNSPSNNELQENYNDENVEEALKNTLADMGGSVAETASQVGETLGHATLEIKKTFDTGDDTDKTATQVGKTVAYASYDISKTIGVATINTTVKAGKRIMSFWGKKV